MTRIENIPGRFFRKFGNPRLFRQLMMSKVAWRLSGLSYQTAVIATTGAYLDVDAYISAMKDRMVRLQPHIPDDSTVIDFGTGIGGNLFGSSHFISRGLGLDINPFFIGHANLISKRKQFSNLSFAAFDGARLPEMGKFDCFLAIGTFERLSKRQVYHYLWQLANSGREHLRVISYFLTEKARIDGFGALMGQENYVFWTEQELFELMNGIGLELVDRIVEFPNAGDCLVMDFTRSSVDPR